MNKGRWELEYNSDKKARGKLTERGFNSLLKAFSRAQFLYNKAGYRRCLIRDLKNNEIVWQRPLLSVSPKIRFVQVLTLDDSSSGGDSYKILTSTPSLQAGVDVAETCLFNNTERRVIVVSISSPKQTLWDSAEDWILRPRFRNVPFARNEVAILPQAVEVPIRKKGKPYNWRERVEARKKEWDAEAERLNPFIESQKRRRQIQQTQNLVIGVRPELALESLRLALPASALTLLRKRGIRRIADVLEIRFDDWADENSSPTLLYLLFGALRSQNVITARFYDDAIARIQQVYGDDDPQDEDDEDWNELLDAADKLANSKPRKKQAAIKAAKTAEIPNTPAPIRRFRFGVDF